MSLTAAVVVLAIDMARTPSDLAAWWRDHQHVLRGLNPSDLAEVVAAKDRAKAALSG